MSRPRTTRQGDRASFRGSRQGCEAEARQAEAGNHSGSDSVGYAGAVDRERDCGEDAATVEDASSAARACWPAGGGAGDRVMSRQEMWDRVRMAWSMLAGRSDRDVQPGRPRESAAPPPAEAAAIEAEGFAEEALPWLDAVYRFSIRLTRGDEDAAEDLVQETFLRAHRFWHTFERGTNAKSWLFTICRNTYLKEKQRLRSRREQPASDLDARVEALSAASAFERATTSPEEDLFNRLIDDQVVSAIDALPDEYREVLVLSDLGDLKYAEIAEVLDIPIGTVRSRLFRARSRLQERLRKFAIASGYVQETA